MGQGIKPEVGIQRSMVAGSQIGRLRLMMKSGGGRKPCEYQVAIVGPATPISVAMSLRQ